MEEKIVIPMNKKFFTLEPCNTAKAYELKFDFAIDLKKAEAALAKKFEILASTAVMLMINVDGNAVTLYASGRALAKYVSKEKANEIGNAIVSLL